MPLWAPWTKTPTYRLRQQACRNCERITDPIPIATMEDTKDTQLFLSPPLFIFPKVFRDKFGYPISESPDSIVMLKLDSNGKLFFINNDEIHPQDLETVRCAQSYVEFRFRQAEEASKRFKHERRTIYNTTLFYKEAEEGLSLIMQPGRRRMIFMPINRFLPTMHTETFIYSDEEQDAVRFTQEHLEDIAKQAREHILLQHMENKSLHNLFWGFTHPSVLDPDNFPVIIPKDLLKYPLLELGPVGWQEYQKKLEKHRRSGSSTMGRGTPNPTFVNWVLRQAGNAAEAAAADANAGLHAPTPIADAPAPIARLFGPIVRALASVAYVPAPNAGGHAPIAAAPAPIANVPAPTADAPAILPGFFYPLAHALASIADAPAPNSDVLASIEDILAPIANLPALIADFPAPIAGAPVPFADFNAHIADVHTHIEDAFLFDPILDGVPNGVPVAPPPVQAPLNLSSVGFPVLDSVDPAGFVAALLAPRNPANPPTPANPRPNPVNPFNPPNPHNRPSFPEFQAPIYSPLARPRTGRAPPRPARSPTIRPVIIFPDGAIPPSALTGDPVGDATVTAAAFAKCFTSKFQRANIRNVGPDEDKKWEKNIDLMVTRSGVIWVADGSMIKYGEDASRLPGPVRKVVELIGKMREVHGPEFLELAGDFYNRF